MKTFQKELHRIHEQDKDEQTELLRQVRDREIPVGEFQARLEMCKLKFKQAMKDAELFYNLTNTNENTEQLL